MAFNVKCKYYIDIICVRLLISNFSRTRRLCLKNTLGRFNANTYLRPNCKVGDFPPFFPFPQILLVLFMFQSPRFLLQFLVDMRELAALHSSNVKLCLNVPNYGKYLPGSRVSDIFTFLGDALPSPKPEQQADFDFVIDEIATLVGGLLEYFNLSQAVFKGIYFFFHLSV